MSFKTKALVAALALAAVGSASAALKTSTGASFGNSSLAFVAMSGDNTSSLVVDLGYQMSDVIQGALAGTSLTAGQSISASWNLSTGAVTLNGGTVAGTFAYSNAASFLGANTGAFTWGVIGADGIGGNVSATNTVASQNMVFTSTALDFDNSIASGVTNAAVAGAAGQVATLFNANNTVTGSTNTAGKFGSSIASAGSAFLGTSIAVDGNGNFAQQIGNNNFLVALTDTAYVMRGQLNNTGLPVVSQLGSTQSVGTALDVANAATFTFDEATSTLTYNVSAVAAVPEASTYAMLLAGLGAVGFMARRRKSA